jgi:hypothetical protein
MTDTHKAPESGEENMMLPSVEADASPQESSMAVEASREVALPAWPDNGAPFGNQWFRELPVFIECLRRFQWVKNFRFKYVMLRIDTRNGNFLVFDQDMNPAKPNDLFPYPSSRVSDEQPKAEDRNGLSAQHASAVPAGQTPLHTPAETSGREPFMYLSPDDFAKVVDCYRGVLNVKAVRDPDGKFAPGHIALYGYPLPTVTEWVYGVLIEKLWKYS